MTAEVLQSSGSLELKNKSHKGWSVSDNGKQVSIAPDCVLNLRKGIVIDFGGSVVRIN
jgi:hypothetical protein